ncbi:MAG TPA: hypothetical protein VGD04_02610 [Methylophilus sp.]
MMNKFRIAFIALLTTIGLSACHSYETYNRLQNFYLSTSKSKTKTVKATEVLGNDWERVCLVTRDLDIKTIESGINRPFSFTEYINWFYISQIADFSESLVLLYEKNGVFFRMEPPLSMYIDTYPFSKRILLTRPICFDAETLYIRRSENNYKFEFYVNKID